MNASCTENMGTAWETRHNGTSEPPGEVNRVVYSKGGGLEMLNNDLNERRPHLL
jgi:hypothetical protein